MKGLLRVKEVCSSMLNISIDCDVIDSEGDLVNTVGLGPFVFLTLYEYIMLIFGKSRHTLHYHFGLGAMVFFAIVLHTLSHASYN